jgi:hypothetical protein
VTLKMFAATLEAGKLERALDLVDRLHLEKSYNLAMTIADSHRKLVDFIEDARDRKFNLQHDDDDENSLAIAEDVDVVETSGMDSQYLQRVSPDSQYANKPKRSYEHNSEQNEITSATNHFKRRIYVSNAAE